jgi:hypothetical protein
MPHAKYNPNTLSDKWTRNPVLLRFNDAVADTTGSYRFTFRDPLKDVVHAEWITASTALVGKLITVNEFKNDGQTSANITTLIPASSGLPSFLPGNPTSATDSLGYWRFISDTNNYLSPSLSIKLDNPTSIYNLTVRLKAIDGTPYTPLSTDYLQIFTWSKCPCKHNGKHGVDSDSDHE